MYILSLTDNDPLVREKAAYTLLNMGSEAGKAVPALLEVIREDENEDVRMAGIRAIGEIGYGPDETKGSLNKTFIGFIEGDAPNELRLEAIKVFSWVGRGEPIEWNFLSLLDNDDPEIKAAAIHELWTFYNYTDKLHPILMHNLNDEDPRVRAAAVMRLGSHYSVTGYFNPPPQNIINALFNALQDESPQVQLHAAIALIGSLGIEVDEALPILIAALDGPELGRGVFLALVSFGTDGAEAIPRMIKIIKERAPEPSLADFLMDLEEGDDLMPYLRESDPTPQLLVDLEKLGVDKAEVIPDGWGRPGSKTIQLQWRNGRTETFRDLSDKLKSHCDEVYVARAISILGSIGPEPGVVETLIELLDDDNSFYRSSAVATLGEMGKEAEIAIPKLLEMLKEDADEGVRGEAARALGIFGADADERILPGVLNTLEKDEFNVRQDAIFAIREMGPQARKAIPILENILDGYMHDDLKLTEMMFLSYAAGAFVAIGPESGEMAPFLFGLLNHKNHYIKKAAFKALSELGIESVPYLIKAYDDESLRYKVVEAFGKFGKETTEIISFLILALEDEDSNVGQKAAEMVAELGSAAKDAVPALIKILESADLNQDRLAHLESLSFFHDGRALIWQCVKALGTIGPDAADSVPVLTKFLSTERIKLREEAMLALASIGESAVSTIPEIISVLSDDNPYLRATAAKALGKFGLLAKESVPHLVSLLSDKDLDVRWNAVMSLGSIGHNVKDYLPELMRLADSDPSIEVRYAAKEAIGKIEGDNSENAH